MMYFGIKSVSDSTEPPPMAVWGAAVRQLQLVACNMIQQLRLAKTPCPIRVIPAGFQFAQRESPQTDLPALEFETVLIGDWQELRRRMAAVHEVPTTAPNVCASMPPHRPGSADPGGRRREREGVEGHDQRPVPENTILTGGSALR